MHAILAMVRNTVRLRPWSFAVALLLLVTQICLALGLYMVAGDKFNSITALVVMLGLVAEYLPFVKLAEVFKMQRDPGNPEEQGFANRVHAYLQAKRLLRDPYHKESPLGTYKSSWGARQFLIGIIQEMATAGLAAKPISKYASALEEHFASFMGHLEHSQTQNVARVSALQPKAKKHYNQSLTLLRYRIGSFYSEMCIIYNIPINQQLTHIFDVIKSYL